MVFEVDLVVTGVAEILKKLVSIVAQEIALTWGIEDELKKLERTLEMIQAVTVDAEKKQANDAAVRLWLRRLKDVAYDADDVLDVFSYEAMRRREMNRKIDKVRAFVTFSNPLAFRLKMAHKIEDINRKLDEIASDKDKFQLQVTSGSICSAHNQTIKPWNRVTSSFVDELKIVGRENEKLDIVKMLMTIHTSSSVSFRHEEKVPVVSIVGMGGIGKTALAQLVFKDDTIEKSFELRIWVCVSDNFDIYRILRNIVESITRTKYDDVSNMEVLVGNVHEKLSGRRYLLVLDDMWNENAEDWENLRSLLNVGARGSKLLVTTRNNTVASIVGCVIPAYNLKQLPEDECWSIIRNKVFSPGGASETPNMTIIGKEIARKCAGLPLAANFLGSLMRLRKDESHWMSIRDSDILNAGESQKRIISILRLSYDNLPSHLKQCFCYWSLFPKGFMVARESLIQIWIAEGFLHPSYGGNGRSLEDIGNDYFESLVSSSFFQEIEKDEFGDIQGCRMHDFVHDLAQSVVDIHEFTGLNVSAMENISEIRRLQLDSDERISQTFPEVLNSANKLRTIFSLNEDFVGINDLIGNKSLRVILLRGGNQIPAFTFKFKHLRYLSLSDSDIGGVSISQLYNLQTLVLFRCVNIQKTVKYIGCLKNLRHLHLMYSDVKMLPDSVVSLSNLQTLDLFACRLFEALPLRIGLLKHLSCIDLSFTAITELPDSVTCISHLRMLKFANCKNLDALPGEFGALAQLRCLDLGGTKIKLLPESCIGNLCNLEIVHLGDKCEFPNEVKNWPKLRRLTHNGEDTSDAIMPRGIEMLTSLEEIKPYVVRKEEVSVATSNSSGIQELASLNSLQVLVIKNLSRVRGEKDAKRAKLMDKQNIQYLELHWEDLSGCDVNHDMVLEGLQPHSNLAELKIWGFHGLKLPKWMDSSSNSLPNLVKLTLLECVSCEQLPALGGLPFLRVLQIGVMKSVKYLGQEFYYQGNAQEESSISGFATPPTFFPSLTQLFIAGMKLLKEWVAPPPPCSSFPFLEVLEIVDCPVLTLLPDLRLQTSLRKLTIWKCEKLKESIPYDLKKSLTFLEKLEIDFIQKDEQRGVQHHPNQ
ncbi:disease resistance protein RGA2-like [Papaver somniferum]|uniref:disease resistance protein RGA2-like n=1 Tax=Papaver somniferum TaxID=3469 RepID=UPI000E6FE03D|nr:disease resistance protein RGA2-like [Papaver somniferum]